jgi:NTP pyrophosphatase (non-canonical NTP hydrolase)
MDHQPGLFEIHVRPGHPDFLDLPWHLPLARWSESCSRLVEVERGLSRHDVVFASYDGAIYALKELPLRAGEREYDVLVALAEHKLPAVVAAGHAKTRHEGEDGARVSVLITRYLESSLPYRTLFMNAGLERYRERLLDAIASLLVRLHLAGFYWGDCSLSNTLFRRDAGELQAYLVDAETSEFHETLADGQRKQDVVIMMENVAGELADLAAQIELPQPMNGYDTGATIRERYERLWSEITREEAIAPSESYRIHERIRALNELGFSVGEVELITSGMGNQIRMRTIVTDRDYHRHMLHSLTGIVAGDRQAALMLNEVREMKAVLSRQLNRSVPMSMAAHRWLHERYHPAAQLLGPLARGATDLPEVYCQVLEHKWYLSERAQGDVGLEFAIQDYIKRFQGD